MDNLQFQNNWVNGKTWLIKSVNGDPVVKQGDIVYFTTTPKTVQIRHVNLATDVWSLTCAIDGDALVGTRKSDKQSFRIQLDSPTQISCQLVNASPRLVMLRSAGPSTFLGALIGAVAGFFVGFPLAGSLIGFAAALTGSVVTAAANASLSISSLIRVFLGNTRVGKYTSSGTWVADDGSAGTLALVRPPLQAAG
jgi:hypothetical protein